MEWGVFLLRMDSSAPSLRSGWRQLVSCWVSTVRLVSGPKGDKPRKVVVCSWGDYPAIQKGVASLGHGDVLVRPSRHIEDGQAYVMDPPPDVII